MINIWEYADADRLRITLKTGEVISGSVVDFMTEDDDELATGDAVTLENADGYHLIEDYEIEAIEEIGIAEQINS